MPRPVYFTNQFPVYSPFQYPGGKTWFIHWAFKWLDSFASPPHIVEPFAGGGSTSLAAVFNGRASHATLVELDPQVAVVWRVVFSDRAEQLARMCYTFNATRDNAEAVIASSPTDDVGRAFRTIVRNRLCFAGILVHSNTTIRLTGKNKSPADLRKLFNAPERARIIKTLYTARDRFTVVEGDAIAELERRRDEKGLAWFIDPPYSADKSGAGSKLYEYHAIDHARLFSAMARLRSPAIMTYDDSPTVLALAAGAGLGVDRVPMRTAATKEIKNELVIGRDLRWLGPA